MCDYVIVGVPAGALRDLEAPEPLKLVAMECPPLSARLPGGYSTYQVVGESGCSCGLYYEEGEEADIARDNAADDARRIARYKKRGWSESRIARAMSSHVQHRDRSDEFWAGKRKAEIAAIRTLERSLARVAERSANGVFVLAHDSCPERQYSRFPLSGTPRPPKKLRLGAPGLERETLVHFGAA